MFPACHGVGLETSDISGWPYSPIDFDPESDGDEEERARAVADEGWRTCHPTGVGVTVGEPARATVGAAPSMHAPVVSS